MNTSLIASLEKIITWELEAFLALGENRVWIAPNESRLAIGRDSYDGIHLNAYNPKSLYVMEMIVPLGEDFERAIPSLAATLAHYYAE